MHAQKICKSTIKPQNNYTDRLINEFCNSQSKAINNGNTHQKAYINYVGMHMTSVFAFMNS